MSELSQQILGNVEAAIHHASSILKLADRGISFEVKQVEKTEKMLNLPEAPEGNHKLTQTVCEAVVIEMKWLPRVQMTSAHAAIDLPPMRNNGLPRYADVDAVGASGGLGGIL